MEKMQSIFGASGGETVRPFPPPRIEGGVST